MTKREVIEMLFNEYVYMRDNYNHIADHVSGARMFAESITAQLLGLRTGTVTKEFHVSTADSLIERLEGAGGDFTD